MTFRQCALIFDKYPDEKSWLNFFSFHQPFWDYFTVTAHCLFPINLMYPTKVTKEWNYSQYQKTQGLKSLEDFFALYFLLIIYQYNNRSDDLNFSRDQEIWKSLWDREVWCLRVSEKELVRSLSEFKSEISGFNQFDEAKV